MGAWFGISLLAVLLVFTPVLAWQPDYILRVNYTTIESDCTPRQSVTINGTVPGPLLELTEGGHYWVRVYNDLPDANTTVHFHGFSQYTTPFSDGTPQVSGWPIPPGHFYDYEFQLEDGFYGTYWYHSHVGFQVVTMQGPVIVHQKNKTDTPVQYDEDVVMMLSDYYHASDDTIYNGLINNTDFAWLGEPQSLLTNGNAPSGCNQTALPNGTQCSTSCGNSLQLVKPNTRYRVRIISGTALSYLGLALEGHNMTLFEVDGTYVEPMQVEDVQLGAAQRYSVLVETGDLTNQTDFYWRIRTMWRPTRVGGSALWRYDEAAPSDAPLSRAVSTTPTPLNLNETVFLPGEQFGWISNAISPWNRTDYPPSDNEVTRTIILNGEQIVSGPQGKGFRWAVNDRLNNGTTPHVPYLVELYSDGPSTRRPNLTVALANGGFDPASRSYPAKLGEVLDIVIQNRAGETSGTAEAHPWHSHGAKYWDMGAGLGNFSYAALRAVRANATGQPFKRDTSVNYPGPGAAYDDAAIAHNGTAGWRLFRIRVEVPGTPLIHCHIAPHQIMGMQTLWAYGTEHLPGVPQSLLDEFLTFGGGMTGVTTYDSGDAHLVEPRSYFAEMAATEAHE